MKRKITLALLGLWSFSAIFAIQTIYVATPANGGSDENDGTVSSPYATLAKATSMVSEDDAEIYIGEGIYTCTETAVLNAYNQKIIGIDAASTILDGNGSVSLVDGITNFQNSEKTLSIEKLGFTNAVMTDETNVLDGGSAIRMGFKTNLELNQCYFANNTASSTSIGFAGAVYFCGNNITVDGCFFEKNNSNSTGTQGYGGAITVRHLFNLDNSATHLSGGATYAVIKNSTFYQNYAFSKGGAIYFNKQLDTKVDDDDATFVVQNCTFVENKSAGGTSSANTYQLGAGVALSSGSNSTNNKAQTIILCNNTFCNNEMISAGTVYGKNSVLLEGFRYTSYMANNIITSDATNGEALYANQPAPIEYGYNNIIDRINSNINGSDFVANAGVNQNQTSEISAATIGLNTSLADYPVSTSFALPYLSLQTGSMAIDAGISSYQINTIANPAPAAAVEYILTTDNRDQSIESSRDLGATEFISTTTDITSNPALSIKVIKTANGLLLTGLQENEKVNVYNLTGSIVYSSGTDNQQLLIPISTPGIYMINAGNNIIKCIR